MKAGGWPVVLVLAMALPALGAPAAAQGAETWSVDDPSGDVYLAGAAPAPRNAVSDHVDLVQVAIRDENETALAFVLAVADLDPQAALAVSQCLGAVLAVGCSRIVYETEWTLNGDPRRAYHLVVSLFGFVDRLRAFGYVYTVEGADPFGGWNWEGSVVVEADAERNELRATVPRAFLAVGRGDQEREPGAGDRITGLVTRAQHFVFAGVLLGTGAAVQEDRAPDAGEAPPYLFAVDGATGALRVETEKQYLRRTEEGEEYEPRYYGPPTEGMAPGALREQAFYVTNGADTKHIVNLSVSVDAATPGWNASVVPQAIVGANESVRVTVLVHAPDEAPHRETAVLRVDARALADPAVRGRGELHLVAARTPTPEEPVLYLHSRPQGRGVLGTAFNAVFPFGYGAMNTVRTDEAYSDEPITIDALLFGGYLYFGLDTPPSQPMYVDPEGTVRLTLHLLSDLPAAEATVRAQVYGGSDGAEAVLAEGTAGGAVSTTGTDLVLEMTPFGTEGPVTDWLALVVQVSGAAPTPDLLFSGGPFLGEVHPAKSMLELPLLPPPRETAAPAAARLSLSLGEERDRVEYVNPGEARAFNVTVLNEADAYRQVGWSLEPDNASWTAWTEGPLTAGLGSGNSTSLRVLARAPAAAREGATLQLNVSAQPLVKGQGPAPERATLALRLIVTRGIDLPDDAPGQGPSPQAKAGGVPGPGLGLVAVAALLAALLRRR